MAASPPKDPLIMVVGATGTGKSKLAVELATRFNGEIINCDAMQMYKGLPIITNKIPGHEQNGIKHHLLDFIDLRERPWSVHQFVKHSSSVIDEIRARGKLPIVVGGTIYYTFSLLFKDALLASDESESGPGDDETDKLEPHFPILSASTEEIFAKLQEVDPEMAKRWHPNDRQKIQNSLRIFLKSGRKASEIYAEQRRVSQDLELHRVSNDSSSAQHGLVDESKASLRFPSLLLWLEAEDSVLKQRLNDRVDKMVAQGLCNEVEEMANMEQQLSEEGVSIDMTSGIWASIGYKEMKPWLELHLSLPPESTKLASGMQEGIEAVKASTRRYAKRQNRFVRIRLARALKSADTFHRLFLLDCTDLAQWDAVVSKPAEALTSAFFDGEDLPEAKSLSAMAEVMFSDMEADTAKGDREARTCEICNKTLMTEKEWNGHLASRAHKKIVAWQRRQDSGPRKQRQPSDTIHLPIPPD